MPCALVAEHTLDSSFECSLGFNGLCLEYSLEGERADFNWQEPKLCAIEDEPVECSKLLMKLVVNETLLRLLCRGQAGLQMMVSIAGAVRDMLFTCLQADPDDVCRAAMIELQDIARVLLMMAGVANPDSAQLQSLFTAKDGVKQLVRHAVARESFWAERESKARSMAVAIVSLQPEMESCLPDLATMDLAGLSRVCQRVPVWTDGLPEGVVHNSKNCSMSIVKSAGYRGTSVFLSCKKSVSIARGSCADVLAGVEARFKQHFNEVQSLRDAEKWNSLLNTLRASSESVPQLRTLLETSSTAHRAQKLKDDMAAVTSAAKPLLAGEATITEVKTFCQAWKHVQNGNVEEGDKAMLVSSISASTSALLTAMHAGTSIAELDELQHIFASIGQMSEAIFEGGAGGGAKMWHQRS
eukprot:6455413-Amphidinium_carterae.2